MSSKKILIAANTSWYLFNFRLSLMQALREQGYEVIAFAPEDEYSSRFEKEGIAYITCNIVRSGKNPLVESHTVHKLRKQIKEIKPDLVLTYTPKLNIYLSFACQTLKIPVVNNIAGLGFAYIRSGVLAKFVNNLYRFTLKKSKKVFFQNEMDYAFFKENKLIDLKVAHILPGSGVDTQKYLPEEKQQKDEKFKFLLVARLLWDKGIGEYIESARFLKAKYGDKIEFQILGHFDMGNPASISKEQLKEWVDEAVINYLGATDDVRPYLREADCAVLPSYREGCPRSLLEAASMALPIVTTDAPGCARVVEDSITGLLCKVKDVESLTKALERMYLLSPEERKTMGRRGREKMIKEYDEAIVIQEYLKVVKELFVGSG